MSSVRVWDESDARRRYAAGVKRAASAIQAFAASALAYPERGQENLRIQRAIARTGDLIRFIDDGQHEIRFAELDGLAAARRFAEASSRANYLARNDAEIARLDREIRESRLARDDWRDR